MWSAHDTTATRAGGRRPAGADPGAGELVLGRYRLARRLGAGGFGVVWLARDERLGRAVAVKRIPVHGAGVAARAEREARAAARLQHPGVVALHESGRDADAVYLVSEVVRGPTLAALLADGALADRDALGIGMALCDALAHAHARGVVHRDVKPGNVIVPEAPGEPGAIAKLTDFGVATVLGDEPLTLTGDVVGTLAYMAPEQAEGRATGPATDLYALGLVLFEALAGANPVRGRGAASTARRVGTRLPPLARARPGLPPALCDAIDRAVLPHPEDRGTLEELRDALAGALPDVDERPGAIAAARVERLARGARAAAPASPPARVLAAAAAAGLVALAVVASDALTGSPAPIAAHWAAPAAAVAVLLLPRLAWLAGAAAAVGWCLWHGATGPAAVLAAALVPVPLLLPRAGTGWSLPAGAVALAAAGLPAAWAGAAGLAPAAWTRAALGLLGGWWAALHAEGSVRGAVEAGGPAVGAVWAAFAVMLPLVVRGRALALDIVGAAAWVGGLAATTGAVTEALALPPAGSPGLAAALAGAAALLAAASRAARRAR